MLSFRAEKCYNIVVFVKGQKTSQTRTHIGQELIGRIQQRTKADAPFHPWLPENTLQLLQGGRLSEMYEVENGRYYAGKRKRACLSRISVRAIRTASDKGMREAFSFFMSDFRAAK